MSRFSLFLIFLLVASLIFNIFLLNRAENKKESTIGEEDNFNRLKEKFPLLAQRILVENPNDILINFLPLRNKLRELTKDYGTSFALYFEYLPTGTSIGVNEKEDFIGASLLKLPIVMAFYHQQQRQTVDFTDKKVKIIKEDIDIDFGDLWTAGEGAEMTLGNAAKKALVESDNTAVNILARNILQQDFDSVYQGLDIDIKSEKDMTFISAKGYSSILKALYFSAVLNKENSQQVLELLSQSSAEDKLRKPLPKDIIVANKFGVYKNEGFQDCGIVYLPKRNYLLCMMSKTDEEEATKRIIRISEAVYNFVNGVNVQ